MNDIEDEFISGVSEERAKIRIPRIALERSDRDPVRMASLLFRNMSGLLPERLEGNENDRLVNIILNEIRYYYYTPLLLKCVHTQCHNNQYYPVSRNLAFRLASPVISASFQCDTCTTSNLSTPVQVTFKHTPYDQVSPIMTIKLHSCKMGYLNIISSYLPPSILTCQCFY